MNVNFYGRLAERIGRQVMIDIPPQGCSVAELRQLIADRHPELQAEILRPRVRACVDDCIAPEGQRVGPAQSVEFFPPVSGG